MTGREINYLLAWRWRIDEEKVLWVWLMASSGIIESGSSSEVINSSLASCMRDPYFS